VDFRIKTFERSSKVVKLQLWDTAGQERFRAITTSYYRGADGIIMMYDMTDPASVDGLAEIWLREVQRHASKSPKIILVGNKSDLSMEMTAENRELVQERVSQLKDRLRDFGGDVVAVETSAKAGSGVSAAFDALVDDMMSAANQKRLVVSTKRGSGTRTSSGLGVNLLGSGNREHGRLCCSLV